MKALAMIALCAALAGCGSGLDSAPTQGVDHNAEGTEGRVTTGVYVTPYVDPKTGTEWLVFTVRGKCISVVPRQPLPAPPSEGE